MLNFVVLASANGRPVPPEVIERVAVADPLELNYPPETSIVWRNASATVVLCGWQAATDVAVVGAHWHHDARGLTAFSSAPCPRDGMWSAERDWAQQLAGRFERDPAMSVIDGLANTFTLAHLPAKGRGYVASDPFGIGLLYRAASPDVVAISNRAGLAARAVTPAAAAPRRDLHTMGWMAYIAYTVGAGTSYEDVALLDRGAYVTLGPGGKSAVRQRDDLVLPGDDTPPAVDDLIEASAAELRVNAKRLVDLQVPNTTLSLSGGKDSRLVLALLLANGDAQAIAYRVDGSPDSPDVVVAQQLAQRFGLDLSVKEQAINRADAASFRERVRAHAYVTEGMLSADTVRTPGRLQGQVRAGGLFGELTRSHYAKAAKISSKKDALRFLARGMGFDAAGMLRPDARATYDAQITTWARRQFERGVRPEDIGDVFYLDTRARTWVGPQEALGFSPRPQPLLSPTAVRAAFALGQRARQMDQLHFEIIRRVAPDLLTVPLAGDVWDPQLYAHLPDGARYRHDAVVATRSGAGSPWQTTVYPRVQPVFEEYLGHGGDNPMFELLDPHGTRGAVRVERPLTTQARVNLYGALGAAVWMAHDEDQLRYGPKGPRRYGEIDASVDEPATATASATVTTTPSRARGGRLRRAAGR